MFLGNLKQLFRDKSAVKVFLITGKNPPVLYCYHNIELALLRDVVIPDAQVPYNTQ